LHLREDCRLAVSRIRLQTGRTPPGACRLITREETHLDRCRAITCKGRAARIVRANHPGTITSLTARSRAAGSDMGGWYQR